MGGFAPTYRLMLKPSFFLGLLLMPALLAARPFTVVVYNVENLHDADGVAVYDDYQPALYTKSHVLTKVQNITSIIAKFGAGQGPDIILFDEVEIDHTPGKTAPDYAAILKTYAGTTIDKMLGADFTPAIADLPAEALLLKAFADRGLTGYTVVAGSDGADAKQHEGKPSQAIKCVVFTRFPVKEVHNYPTVSARNILEVKVDVDGYPLTLFNNHWKSGAGDTKTEPLRIENAKVMRARLDELLKADPNADIIIGGDLNSHYNQKRRYRKMPETAINDILGSQGNELAIRGPARDLYNLWFELPEEDRGSDVFQGEWGTLMNLIVTRGLYDLRGVQYIDNSFGVAKFPGLNADAAGLPVRYSGEGPGGSGFSDHFPIFARFQTVDDNQPGKFVTLTRESGKEDAIADAIPNKVDLSKTDFASAIVLSKLPADTKLRDGTWTGKLFRVEAKALDDRLLRVEANGETYDVYGPRKEIRDLLYAQRRENAGTLTFYGELGTYKGTWQFLVKSEAWVK
jgi:hypothetical protein